MLAQANLCASAPTAWLTHRSFLKNYWPTKENNMASKFKAVSEKDRCVACGVCVKVCPKGAISIYKGCYSVVDEDICIGCGICERNCPAGVIHKIPR
ncbi:MAG: 4Fe-4S binding protein [Bacteroidales bacterium]|nr:4Fe-4S binding protein [Bacteroidales bacterium]